MSEMISMLMLFMIHGSFLPSSNVDEFYDLPVLVTIVEI